MLDMDQKELEKIKLSSSSFQAATVTADMDLGLSAINATAVVGHKGWLAGYQTCFDITKSAVTKNNFGLGYTAQDFVLHTSVVNGTDFGGSVYQKVQLVIFDLSVLIFGLQTIGMFRCHLPWRLAFPLDGALPPPRPLLVFNTKKVFPWKIL